MYKTLEIQKREQEEQAKKEESFASGPRGIYQNLYGELAQKTVSGSNVWHKYPLKLFVYSNDVGEALRPIIGNFLAKLSWLPAILYTILALISQKNRNNDEYIKKEIMFQSLASFILPFCF